MHTAMVFKYHMSLRVFDTQFGAHSMENIGEIWYCLVSFLMKDGPSCVLVLVASNMVVLFFNGIPEGISCGGDHKYFIFLYVPLLRVSIPPILNMGNDLEECKSNISLTEKLWTEKYSSSIFIHLSTTYASNSPSNNGISKFTCTLKGVSWSLDEDVSSVGSG
jgi:hypothetical protein